jgi:hypothetical protein
LPLIFATCCLSNKTQKAASQQAWTLSSTVPLFNLGNILIEPFAMFIGDGSHVFRKIPKGNAENEVSVALYDEISSCRISPQFMAFSSPRKMF